MSAGPQNRLKHKDIHVEFGKRFSAHNNRPPPVLQQTCERCCGTGRIRERGNRIICKACAGSGRITMIKERAG
jgi:DnaJ-class molecular chaperone